MISLLIKLFIKDSENVKDTEVRRKYGMLSSITGIALNIILFLGKYSAGLFSNSVAIMTDAFNNLSDAGSSIITLVGFKFAGMKSDNEHPFGHGRIEYISGFIVSIIIILMGAELIKTSVEKILNPTPVEFSMITVLMLVFSIIVKTYMFFYNYLISKKIDSSAMKATAVDSFTDSIATAVVLASMIIIKFFNVNIDGWCGILVAAFIFYAGCTSAKETLSPLLGQAPEPEFVENIKKIVLSHEEIMGIHDLVVHNYGPGRIMISLHGEVSGDGNIFELHDAIDRIENELNEKLGCEAVIHMDPIAVNNEVINAVHEKLVLKIKNIDEKISIHDFRMVQGSTHTNLIFDVVVPHNFKMTDKEVKEAIENTIKDTWENYYPVIKIEKSYV